MTFYDLNVRSERCTFEPTIPVLKSKIVFEVIKEHLLNGPFNSYRCVTDFTDAAVSDGCGRY